MKKEQRIFKDVSIPAYFEASGKQFKIKPQKNQEGFVEFLVEGIGIDEAVSELYQNRQVGALDFVKALKSLRSSIFALRGRKGGDYD